MDKDKALQLLAIDNARKDFWRFCLYMNYEFFSKRSHLLKDIADEFNKAYYKGTNKGNSIRINISIFRRAGKSYITTLFICWLIGKRKDITIMRATYSKEHSIIEHDKIRNVLTFNEKYKRVFNDVIMDVDNATDIRLQGSNNINVRSVSVGAGTGIGVNVTIADDVYKGYAEAKSETTNNVIKRWYRSSFANSLEGDLRIEIVINTRWAKDELADELEQANYFDAIIKKKALVNDKSVDESIKTTAELLELQRIEPTIFNSMYQQEYSDAEVGLIDTSYINYVPFADVPRGRTFAVIDNKTTGKDFYAVAIFTIVTNGQKSDIYLTDTVFTQEKISDELENRVASILIAHNCVFAFFETNKDYSHYRIMKKKLMGSVRCQSFTTSSNKEARIILNGKYMNKFNYVSTNDKDYTAFMNNVISYDLNNKNTHDDAPDTLALACEKVLQTSWGKRLGVTGEWRN